VKVTSAAASSKAAPAMPPTWFSPPWGHNFRRILAWLRDFWRLVLTALIAAIGVQSALRRLTGLTHEDYDTNGRII
jgi:hypothetical protein